jgi:DNA-binding PadR family transcriptional regulator
LVKEHKRHRYLSEEQVKLRILSYLCSQKDSGGAFQYAIENRAGIPKQESNRFKGFLLELYEKNCITTIKMDTSAHERGRVIYQITKFGEEIIAAFKQYKFDLVLGPLKEEYSCPYCNDFQITDNKGDYEMHVSLRHPDKPAYPSKTDLQRMRSERKEV